MLIPATQQQDLFGPEVIRHNSYCLSSSPGIRGFCCRHSFFCRRFGRCSFSCRGFYFQGPSCRLGSSCHGSSCCRGSSCRHRSCCLCRLTRRSRSSCLGGSSYLCGSFDPRESFCRRDSCCSLLLHFRLRPYHRLYHSRPRRGQWRDHGFRRDNVLPGPRQRSDVASRLKVRGGASGLPILVGGGTPPRPRQNATYACSSRRDAAIFPPTWIWRCAASEPPRQQCDALFPPHPRRNKGSTKPPILPSGQRGPSVAIICITSHGLWCPKVCWEIPLHWNTCLCSR